VQAVALDDCALVADQRPDLLAEHLSSFFVRFSEPVASKRARLRILVALASEKNVRTVLAELVVYVKDTDVAFSTGAIDAMGTVAVRVPKVAGECLKHLIELSQSKKEAVIAQAVLVLRSVLQSSKLAASAGRAAVITRLVGLLASGKVTTPPARATVYWLAGQYAHEGLIETVGPDLVRIGAKGFAAESAEAKLQLLTLSAKLVTLSRLAPLTPNLRPLALLFTYLTTLARYDLDYGVRDRARFLKGLLASGGVGVVRAQEGAKLKMSEEDFRRGVQVEQLGGGNEQDVDETSLSVEAVWKVLFPGKNEGGTDSKSTQALHGAPPCSHLSVITPPSPRRNRRTRDPLPLAPEPAPGLPDHAPALPDHRPAGVDPRPPGVRASRGHPAFGHARPAGLWLGLARQGWRASRFGRTGLLVGQGLARRARAHPLCGRGERGGPVRRGREERGRAGGQGRAHKLGQLLCGRGGG